MSGGRQLRSDMAALVARWAIPTPEEAARGKRKARATAAEMEERGEVARWLVATAGRRLSRRGVAYRAEALLGLPKTDKAFRYIEEATLAERDNGGIAWELIRDGRRQVIRHGRWDSLAEHVRAAADHHELDLWADAPVQGQAWIEKEDLADALAERARALGLDVYPASGFTGAGFLRAAIKNAAADPRPLVVFLLCDFDSSGARMRETFERRARRFAADLGVDVAAIEHVALTREQVVEHAIPTRPQKDSTHRRDGDDEFAAELDAVDALYPDLLGDWLQAAVDPYCPAPLRAAAREQERHDRRLLAALADKFERAEG
jgi:hypothetical protein